MFEYEIKQLDQLLLMRNRYAKGLLGRGFEGIRHYKKNLEEAPRMSLGQYAITLKTEQSQKLHYSFCFKSEKNMPVLCDPLVETPVKQVSFRLM